VNAVAALVVLLAGAQAQNLAFTSRTHPACPVEVSAISGSRDAGFQSAMLRNETHDAVESVRINVSFSTTSGEEIVETADFAVQLAAGQSKRINLGLGKIRELTERARFSSDRIIRIVLFIESARFSDGNEWRGDEQLVYDPLETPSQLPIPRK
jgi:hypothetical protein